MMLFGTVKKVLDDRFESEHVKSALMGWAQAGAVHGPAASNFGLLGLRLFSMRPWKVARGDIGAISQAMQRAAEHLGVCIKTGCAVQRILVENGRASGVKLASGEKVSARVVISNLDLERTFISMVGIEYLDNAFATRLKRIHYDPDGCSINLALNAIPDFDLPEERLNGWFQS